MANVSSDPLFQLVKSLSKSEKRHFKLFVKRSSSKEDMKFLQLFDVLDHQQDLQESLVLEKIPTLKKEQLSNMKAHLYKQILSSLRLFHLTQNEDIALREQIDHAKILYNRGLYKQALKLLDKTKLSALEAKQSTIALEALEFEKLIESQYITRSLSGRADELSEQSLVLCESVTMGNRLSNLALNLYGLYLKVGSVRNEKDHIYVQQYMASHMPVIVEEELGFFEKLYYYQAQVWYHYIVQDFLMCYRYAQKWVNLFKDDSEMRMNRTSMYVKGIHNLLTALFYLNHYPKFCEVLEELEKMKDDKAITQNANNELLYFLYLYTAKINKHFLEGTFQEAEDLIPELEEKIISFQDKLDINRILVFYYKIACIYFGNGDNENAIHYLQKIIAIKDISLHEDIHCFARILNLIAHYEAGFDEKLEQQIKATYHFLGRMDDLHLVQTEIFQFLRGINKLTPENLKREFKQLKYRLEKHANNKYERRPFLYLDIISWLESKISNKPVHEIIREKFQGKTWHSTML